jgi:hypothetical protein
MTRVIDALAEEAGALELRAEHDFDVQARIDAEELWSMVQRLTEIAHHRHRSAVS